MKIAVLSCKGGTGKTFVSVNLAATSKSSLYVDCDVEEPNGYLFFKPENVDKRPIEVKIPYFNEELCSGCRKCVDFCKFNALAYIGNRVKVFDRLCHSCGGCSLLCERKAIFEKDKIIGFIELGASENVQVATGILNTGESTGVPIIKKLLEIIKERDKNTFIDCPPGSACTVMESIKESDYCILVAEPTLFGRHNLKMVYELVKLFNKPHGAILNKYMDGDNPSEEFCLENHIKILGKVPFDKNLARINSKGIIAVREYEVYRNLFKKILADLEEEVRYETAINSKW